MKNAAAKKIEEVKAEEKKYTYADLLEMNDDKRYEIIDGNLYLMSSPSREHQMLAGKVYADLLSFLEGKKCTPFIAPFDVALSRSKQDNKIFNVVQPDVFVVCDTNKVQKSKVFGAPDFVIEILSPSSKRQDRLYKFNLYGKYKVKEYWIIDPEDMSVWPYLLNQQGIYEIKRVYDLRKQAIPVKVLKGCKINLKEFIKENKDWFDSTKDTK